MIAGIAAVRQTAFSERAAGWPGGPKEQPQAAALAGGTVTERGWGHW